MSGASESDESEDSELVSEAEVQETVGCVERCVCLACLLAGLVLEMVLFSLQQKTTALKHAK